MAAQEDVRRLALGLPEVIEAEGSRFLVGGKAFVWPWLERHEPKRPRVPNPDVVAVRVAADTEKDALIELDPTVFFTEPHYDGYPAILVRLAAIDVELLGVIIRDGWRCRAPKRLLRAGSGGS